MNKKTERLGEGMGAAQHKLRRNLLYYLAGKLEMLTCFRCKENIESPEVFSIEHKEAWLNSENPVKLFYDLENIAFSHKSCNYGAATSHNKKYFTAEEKRLAHNRNAIKSKRKNYSPEKRHKAYVEKGY